MRAYQQEHEAALFYGALATHESDPTRREALEALAEEEAAHAQHWAGELALRAGELAARAREQATPEGDLPSPQLPFGDRIVVWLARRLGIRAVAPLLARREGREAAQYRTLWHPDQRLQERRHVQIVRALGRGDVDPLAVDPWSDDEGFNLRAAIFGINDGLVSNLSLTAGLAGAQVEPQMVILGGVAGLLSGALSMAGGEYLSVRSQRELMKSRIERLKAELEEAPEGAIKLLTATYRSRGMPAEDAERTANAVLTARADPKGAMGGLGSPVAAMVSSFLAFAAGAAVPLVPYFFAQQLGLLFSLVATACALAAAGALVGILSDRGAASSAARMLGIGGVAAAVTYLAGRIFDLQAGG